MNGPSPVWAHRQSNTGGDRRRSPRFKPLAVIPAGFGAPGWRIGGQIANISTTGMGIQRHWSIHPELMQHDVTVEVDFALGDDFYMATAKLIRVVEDLASLQFDQQLPECVVQTVVERAQGSAVQWQPGRAIVHGSLGIRVLADILHATENGRVIDLRHVNQIDNAGIGLALLMQDRRGTFDSCHPDIRDLLSATGVCSRCAGMCERSGKRT